MFLRSDASESESSASEEDYLANQNEENETFPLNKQFLKKSPNKQEYQDYQSYSRKKQLYQSPYLKQQSSKENKQQQQRIVFEKPLFSNSTPKSKKQKTESEYDYRKQLIMKDYSNLRERQQCNKYKELLEFEIRKNKELEHRLFLREKLIIELKSQNQLYESDNKRLKSKAKDDRKTKKQKIKKVKEIEHKINTLKSKCRQVESMHSLDKYRILHEETIKLRNQNKKYKRFVKAFGQSLSIINHQSKSIKDIKQIWNSWKGLMHTFLQKIGKQNS